METEDIQKVLSWNENTESFIWLWPNFTYPLSEEQYLEKIKSEDFFG